MQAPFVHSNKMRQDVSFCNIIDEFIGVMFKKNDNWTGICFMWIVLQYYRGAFLLEYNWLIQSDFYFSKRAYW